MQTFASAFYATCFPFAVALALCSIACSRRAPLGATSDAGDAPLGLLPPADHALANELAEGTEKAFGLPIPRRMTVTARFSDSVFAEGNVPLNLVATFMRQRLTADREEAGPDTVTFVGVTSKSEPDRIFRVELAAPNGATELVVRDKTKPLPEPDLRPEERWRKLGLSPQGQPLDPTRLQ